MPTTYIKLCVIGLLAWTASASAGSISTVIDSRGRDVTIQPTYASVNNNPLYVESSSSGTNPLYEGRLSNRTIVTDPGMNLVGVSCLTPSGAAAFQSVTPGAPSTNGIFVRPAGGGTLITISGSNFKDASGAPVMNDAGTVAFKSLDGDSVLYTKPSGGGVITFSVVVTDRLGNNDRLGRPAVNTAADELAFTGDGSDGTFALYVKPAGSNNPIIITISGSNFFTAPQIVGNHLIATETFSNNTSQPVTFARASSSDDFVAGPVKWMAPESLDRTLSLADDGDVAVCDGQSLQVFSDAVVWDGGAPPADARIVQVGDPLDGSTISSLSLAPQSWSGNDLTFAALLADGTTGLFSVSVPEPSIAAAIGLSVFALLIRPRKRLHLS